MTGYELGQRLGEGNDFSTATLVQLIAVLEQYSLTSSIKSIDLTTPLAITMTASNGLKIHVGQATDLESKMDVLSAHSAAIYRPERVYRKRSIFRQRAARVFDDGFIRLSHRLRLQMITILRRCRRSMPMAMDWTTTPDCRMLRRRWIRTATGWTTHRRAYGVGYAYLADPDTVPAAPGGDDDFQG
jgi:hypothetical protein